MSSKYRKFSIALSKPLTARFPIPADAEFRLVADESQLIWDCESKLPAPFGKFVAQCIIVLKLLRARPYVDVLAAGRYGEIFGLIQAVIPFRKKPFLLLDTEWTLVPRSPIKKVVVRAIRRLTAHGASKIQVFCHAEAERYSEYFGIPISKFVWIPYCPPDNEVCIESEAGDYIVSGGLHDRDWETFSSALGDLDIKVHIAAPEHEFPACLRTPNMKFLGRISREEYFRQIARCRLVVLSVTPIVRFPGVITYVYAMRLGKCVIINEPHGATSYIQDGLTGRVIPNNDASALKSAVLEMLSNVDLQKSIGEQARIEASNRFTPQAYWNHIAEIARQL